MERMGCNPAQATEGRSVAPAAGAVATSLRSAAIAPARGASALCGRTHARLSVYWGADERRSSQQIGTCGAARRVRARTVGVAVAATAVVVVALLQSGVGDGEGARTTGVSVTVDATHPRRAVPGEVPRPLLRAVGAAPARSVRRQRGPRRAAALAGAGRASLRRRLGGHADRVDAIARRRGPAGRRGRVRSGRPEEAWKARRAEAAGTCCSRSASPTTTRAAAAREAKAAKAALGPWLLGIELGNEPDAYAQHGLRSASWSFSALQRRGGGLPARDREGCSGHRAGRPGRVGFARVRKLGARRGRAGCTPRC